MNEPIYPNGIPLKDFILPGDVFFQANKGLVSKLIRVFTDGKINHALLAYDSIQSFETDGEWLKAGFHNLPKVTEKGNIIIRPMYLTDINRPYLQELCRKYEGVLYDFWDCATNALFSWLKDNLRERLLTLIGTKRLMKCDELVSRILYETCDRKELKLYEGLNPQRLLQIMLETPLQYRILYWNL